MKKIFTILGMIAASVLFNLAMAQPPQEDEASKEQKLTQNAYRIAEKLMLSDAQTEKFVPVYSAYKKDLNAVKEQYRQPKRNPEQKQEPLTDSEVDARIRADFAKSQAILDVRKAYYEKLLKVLSPKQIRKVYEIEKQQAEAAEARRAQKAGGAPGMRHETGSRQRIRP